MTAPIDQMRLPLQSDLPDGADGFVVSDCNRAAVEAACARRRRAAREKVVRFKRAAAAECDVQNRAR